MALPYSSSASSPPNPMPSPAEVRQDVQRLTALRPPTDPATGEMVYNTPQAAKYREALQGIVDRYDSVESFQDAMRDSGVRPEQELAAAAPPAVPNVTAGPPAEVNLARFAANLMARGPQGAPSVAAPGPLPAAGGMAQNAGLPARIPRRGTGTVL